MVLHGNKMEGVVLNRVCILRIFFTMQLQKDCGKHGTAHWVNTVHTV